MKGRLFIIAMLVPMLLYAQGAVKVGDLTAVNGLKQNQVFGYGIVVGLQGTGDTKSPLAESSVKNMLSHLGLEGHDIQTKNTAAVLVTATLPPFVRIGDKVDVQVSSIGNAKSLAGGVLIQSPLKGADGQTYVVAQGTLSVGSSEGGRAVNTNGTIVNGGIVENEIVPAVIQDDAVMLVLKQWDYRVADDIVKAVLEKYPESEAAITENGRISIKKKDDVPLGEFIGSIQELTVSPSQKARVVVHEQDGTIVTGGEVMVSEAMVSRNGMVVEIAGARKKQNVAHLKESTSVKELVDALNAVGATTEDVIAILKALKDSGALHAELVVK